MKQRGMGKSSASEAAHRTWRFGLVSVLACACLVFAFGCARTNDSLNALNGRQMQPEKIVVGKTKVSTDFHYMRNVSWSPDSKYFAVLQTTGLTAAVVVYDAATQKIVMSLEPQKCGPYSGDGTAHGGDVSFSPDGRYLAGGFGIITLWDTKTWKPVRDILGPYSRGANAASAVESIAFSPDSKSLAVFYKSVIWPESVYVGGRDEVIARGRQRKKDNSPDPFTHEAAIMSFDVETANRMFVVKEIKATDAKNRITYFFNGRIFYSKDGKYILLNSSGVVPIDFKKQDDDPLARYADVNAIDAHSGKLSRVIQDAHVMKITASALSHDGKWLATGTGTGSKESRLNYFTKKIVPFTNTDPIRIWDVASGKKLLELGPIRGGVLAFAFSPDDRTLISCQVDLSENETIWLWDLASGQLIERVSTSAGLDFHSCALSPDGRTLAMPASGTIYLVHIKQ